MALNPPLFPTWLPGLSIARPPSNSTVQFLTTSWDFLFPQGVTSLNTPVSSAVSLLCEIPSHTPRTGLAFSSNEYQCPQSAAACPRAKVLCLVHPNTCTAQSFETPAVLADLALLLRALAAAMEQMTQTGQSA